MDMMIGVVIGLVLAASGWTLTKIVSWIEAKTAHTTALATAALAPPVLANYVGSVIEPASSPAKNS